MRLFEIESAKHTDLQELANACDSWIALEHSVEDIKLILSHPFSQKFKTISASKVYRSVFYPYKKFLKMGIAKIKPQSGGIVAYSLKEDWRSTTRSDFDYGGDILKFQKTVHGGVVLNFTSLCQALHKNGAIIDQIDEAEVWMDANTYYTTFNKEEFIDAELSNGKTISGKISQVTINRFKKLVTIYKLDPIETAKELGIPTEMIPQLLL